MTNPELCTLRVFLLLSMVPFEPFTLTHSLILQHNRFCKLDTCQCITLSIHQSPLPEIIAHHVHPRENPKLQESPYGIATLVGLTIIESAPKAIAKEGRAILVRLGDYFAWWEPIKGKESAVSFATAPQIYQR